VPEDYQTVSPLTPVNRPPSVRKSPVHGIMVASWEDDPVPHDNMAPCSQAAHNIKKVKYQRKGATDGRT
jgi:hypothetical protein